MKSALKIVFALLSVRNQRASDSFNLVDLVRHLPCLRSSKSKNTRFLTQLSIFTLAITTSGCPKSIIPKMQISSISANELEVISNSRIDLYETWCDSECVWLTITAYQNDNAKISIDEDTNHRDSSLYVSPHSVYEIVSFAKQINFFKDVDYEYKIDQNGKIIDSTLSQAPYDVPLTQIRISSSIDKKHYAKSALLYSYSIDDTTFTTERSYFELRKMIIQKTVGYDKKYRSNAYDD